MDKYLENMVKSPSSSTEATYTSAATSSIHHGTTVTEERRLRTAAYLQSSDFSSGSGDSQRPSISQPIVEEPSSMRQHETSSFAGEKCRSSFSSVTTSRRVSSVSGRTAGKRSSSHGQVQLQICHDPKANILYVTVQKAKLPKQHNDDGTDHVQVDPYIVVYLLPERILENQRRTRHVSMCSSPQWKQTMVYPNVTATDLKTKLLEVSAWNYNPAGDDNFLGKVVFDLSGTKCSSFSNLFSPFPPHLLLLFFSITYFSSPAHLLFRSKNKSFLCTSLYIAVYTNNGACSEHA